MTGRSRPLIALLAFCAAALATPALEVPLKYVAFDNHQAAWPGFMPTGMKGADKLTDKAPAGLKLPKFISAKPAFGTFEFAGTTYHFALDNKSSTDTFYRRLIFDRNHNLDLRDDKPCACQMSAANRSDFEPLDLKIEVQGKQYACMLSFETMDFEDTMQKAQVKPEHIFCMINSSCAFLGEFDLAGKHYRVALADMNCNGTIGDHFSKDAKNGVSVTSGGKQVVYNQGDAFLMTASEKFDANDLLVLGSHLAVGDTIYSVRVDMAGPKLILEPVTGKLASLAVPAGTSGCELVAEDQKTSVMMIDPGEKVSLPAGAYSVFKAMLTKRDAQGDAWCAVAQGSPGAVRVAANLEKPAALKFGEPFLLAINTGNLPQTGQPPPEQLQLSLSITDAAGMDVRGVFHIAGDKTKIEISKDKSHPAEPAYIISKPDGKELERGQFEYG